MASPQTPSLMIVQTGDAKKQLGCVCSGPALLRSLSAGPVPLQAMCS